MAHLDWPPLGQNTVYVSEVRGLLPLEKDACASIKTISKELKAALCSAGLASQSREVTEDFPTNQNHSKTTLTTYGEQEHNSASLLCQLSFAVDTH